MALQVTTAGTGVVRDAHYVTPTGASAAVRTLLLEPQRTNLTPYSDDAANAAWTKTDITVTSDAVVSPISGVLGDLLTEGVAGTAAIAPAGITVSSGAVHAYSHWVKAGAVGSWVRLSIADTAAPTTNFVRGWFNVTTGVVGSVALGGTGTSGAVYIESFGNGWYRCTVVGALTGITAYRQFMSSASADASMTRVNSATYYVTGAQMEAGAVPSSYIPTVATTITRNADSLYWALASLVPREMTVYVRGVFLGTGTNDRVFHIGGAAAGTDPRWTAYRGTVGFQVTWDNGSATSDTVQTVVAPTLFDVVEIRSTLSSAGLSGLGASINGAAEVLGTVGTAQALTASFADTRFYLNSAGTTNIGLLATTNLAIALGTKTRAEMRAIAGV
jgi:hypothetical protein